MLLLNEVFSERCAINVLLTEHVIYTYTPIVTAMTFQHVIIILLLLFLGTKHLADASESISARRVAKVLTVPIILLLASFVIIVAFTTIEILP